MKHISFDIETLDTRASAVVLSIGAVVFDEKALLNEVKINVSIEEQLRWGRTIGGKTLLFWFEQSGEARLAATIAPLPVAKALSTFAGFILGVGKNTPLWANGQDFDLGIVGSLYDTFGVERPWAYNAGRDMRTLVSLYGGKPDIPFEGEKHDSLSDAKHQARIIQFILGKVKVK